jgi:hypothetical protein
MLPASVMLVADETVTFTGAEMLLLIAVDKLCCITRVGTKVVPPPKEKDTASPEATNPIKTPIAPD